MLRLEPVNAKNVWSILKLSVSEEQKDFVAPNDMSIIEAYATLAGGGHVFPFGIYDGDTPVGFVMIGYDVDDSYDAPPSVAYGNYSIWRFMIDQQYQHRGYGTEALTLALDFVRSFPCGRAECCYLSYEPENELAKKLYGKFGFAENGERDDDEIVAVMKL